MLTVASELHNWAESINLRNEIPHVWVLCNLRSNAALVVIISPRCLLGTVHSSISFKDC